MASWQDPISAARADLELEVARLREVNAKQAGHIGEYATRCADLTAENEALREQLRQAQQRRSMARSGE